MHSEKIIHFFDEAFNENDLCKKYQFIKRSTSRLKGQEFIKRNYKVHIYANDLEEDG